MIQVSERYAEALFSASTMLGCIGDVADELPEITSLVRQCGEYLYSPRVTADEKNALLGELLSDKFSPVTLEFLALMLKRRHLKYLAGAAERFRHMCDDFFCRATVSLRVPFAPDQELLDRLKSRFALEGLIPENAENVSFQVTEDKEIIGGFIAYCNGHQIDVSIRTLLANIRRAERYGASI